MCGLIFAEDCVEKVTSRVGIEEDPVTDSSVVGSFPGTPVLAFDEEVPVEWWSNVV